METKTKLQKKRKLGFRWVKNYWWSEDLFKQKCRKQIAMELKLTSVTFYFYSLLTHLKNCINIREAMNSTN